MTDRWISFDCYGTLIDWERGIADTLGGLWPDADRARLLERYHEIEPQVQRGSDSPYREILASTLAKIADAEQLELPDDERDALAQSLPEWPPFAEVPHALAELRSRGWLLAILSNTDPDLLEASIGRIGVDIDRMITVAEAGSYKPAHGHWDAFFETTGADRARHVHVARSLFHDIAPATELGLRRVWVNRADETTDLRSDAEIVDLRELPHVLDGLVDATLGRD